MKIDYVFKHKLLPGVVVALAAIALVAVVACGEDEPDPTAAPQPTATTAPAAPTAPGSNYCSGGSHCSRPRSQRPQRLRPAPSGPSGNVTIAAAVGPLIQHQRRDISAVGGLGRSLSVWETIVRAPFVAPPNPPPQDHTGYSPDDLGHRFELDDLFGFHEHHVRHPPGHSLA